MTIDPHTTLKELDAVIESFGRNGVVARLDLDESQRQALLLAMARLSVERPGWDDMLAEIALKIDINTVDQLAFSKRPKMYDEFRAIFLADENVKVVEPIAKPRLPPLIQIVRRIQDDNRRAKVSNMLAEKEVPVSPAKACNLWC